MKRKHAVAAIFCVAAIGFTWVSPYIAMYRISMAARSVRMAGLEQQADLAAVRASVMQQLQTGGYAHDAVLQQSESDSTYGQFVSGAQPDPRRRG